MIIHTRSFDHEPPLAIYYEHPEWFKPLFAELERRGVAYDRLLAHQHVFDPAVRESPYALIVNRMSPSAFKRGHTQAIFGTLPYLALANTTSRPPLFADRWRGRPAANRRSISSAGSRLQRAKLPRDRAVLVRSTPPISATHPIVAATTRRHGCCRLRLSHRSRVRLALSYPLPSHTEIQHFAGRRRSK